MRIREAAEADLPAITAIYAHHVLHGTGTFEEEPPDRAEMAARLAKVLKARCAWLVSEDETGITGFAYFAPFRDRSAYRFCAENSVYVREGVRGQGVGKALVAELLARAETRGFRQMLAVIGDSENAGSIGLHASLGFRQAGVIHAVGLKFGRWLDVVFMQKSLGEGDRDIPA
ncbi:MAG TPA: GNAT family N-acetyltransferase [Acetobacteraceae bacterium]|nr:GNAT family N-acetyltransferase [Acetobacteraceae bacterium]